MQTLDIHNDYIDKACIPTITLHIVPKDRKVEIKPDVGMNFVVVGSKDFKLSLAKQDAFKVVSNAILYGSSTNALRLSRTYEKCNFEYEGFGNLDGHICSSGKVTSKDLEYVKDSLVNTNVQVYMMFILFAVNVWLAENQDRKPKIADLLNVRFKTRQLLDLWHYTVNTFNKVEGNTYECKLNNITFNLTLDSEGDILKLFEDWVGIGKGNINAVVHN